MFGLVVAIAIRTGAYAVQSRVAVFVAKRDENYSSVMDLPSFQQTVLLKEVGVDVLESVEKVNVLTCWGRPLSRNPTQAQP